MKNINEALTEFNNDYSSNLNNAQSFGVENQISNARASANNKQRIRQNIRTNSSNHWVKWEAAKRLNRVAYAVNQSIEENSFKPEQDFYVNVDKLKEDNIPFEYWDEFKDASSQEQYDEVWSNIQDELKYRETLQNAGGVEGFLYEAGASITDPVQLGIGIATAPIAAMHKGGTIALLAKEALSGGIEGALVGAMINKGLHTYTNKDVLNEALLSAGFNSTLSGIGVALSRKSVINEELYQDFVDVQPVDDVRDATQAEMVKRAQRDLGFTNATEAVHQAKYFDTDTIDSVVETWQNQINAANAKVDSIDAKITAQEEKLAIAQNNNDFDSVEAIQNNIDTLTNSYASAIDNAIELEGRMVDFQNLSPIEQMDAMNKAHKETFGDLNKYEFTNSEKDIETLSEYLSDDDWKTKSVGAAKTDAIDNETFAQRFETDHDVQADFRTDVGENVNNAVYKSSRSARKLATNQEKLNLMGGVGRDFGRLVFGDIATIQKTKDLQIEKFSDGWRSKGLQKQVEQYIAEINEVSGGNISRGRAEEIAYTQLTGDKTFGEITEAQANVSKKFNEGTELFYQKYNRVKTVSAEMEKQFKQRELSQEFQSLIEGSRDGKPSLAMAYEKEFRAKATRNGGFTNARNELMEMISMTERNADGKLEVLEKYPELSNEFISSLQDARKNIEQLYTKIGQEMIEAGLDTTGIIANGIEKGNYSGPRMWNVGTFNDAQQRVGLDPLITFFREALEATNPNLKYPKKLSDVIEEYPELNDFADDIFNGKVDYNIVDNTDVKSGSKKKIAVPFVLDKPKAKMKGKPRSRVLAKALVENSIKRERQGKIINNYESSEALEMAFNDLDKYIETNKSSLSEEELFELKDAAEFLKKSSSAKKSERGIKKSMRARMDIDENYKGTIVNQDTGESIDVSVRDFLENNAEKRMQSYINTSSSALAFAKNGIKSIDDLTKMLKEVETQNQQIKDRIKTIDYRIENNILDDEFKDLKDLKTERKNLDAGWLTDEELVFYKDMAMHMYKGTTPIDYNNPLNKALQYMNNYNFMRMMGKMPLAQVSELSEIAHQAGITTMLKSMPSVKQMFGRIKQLDKDGLKNLEESLEAFGFIGDNYHAGWFNDVGDEFSLLSFSQQDNKFGVKANSNAKLLSNANDIFHKGSRYSGMISSKMDKMTRMWAVKSAFSELDKLARFFVNDAGDIAWHKRQSELISKRGINENTLIEYGLTIDELPLIKQAFDKYAVFKKSNNTGNRIIQGFDLTGLKYDEELSSVFDKLRDFSINAQNEVVAPNTIANSYKSLVDNMLIKTIFQFRSYAIQSVDHKLRHKLRGDNNVASYLMLGAFTGMMSYVLNVLSNAPKYENSDEYIESQLSTGKLIAGSYSRSVYSYLMPGILGSIEQMTTGDNKYFGANTRTSGMSQSLTNIPFTNLLDNVGGLGTNLVSAATGADEKGLEKATRNAVALLPIAAAPILGPAAQASLTSKKVFEE